MSSNAKKLAVMVVSAMLMIVGCSQAPKVFLAPVKVDPTAPPCKPCEDKKRQIRQVSSNLTGCFSKCANPCNLSYDSTSKILKFNSGQITCSNGDTTNACWNYCIEGAVYETLFGAPFCCNLQCSDLATLQCNHSNPAVQWDLSKSGYAFTKGTTYYATVKVHEAKTCATYTPGSGGACEQVLWPFNY